MLNRYFFLYIIPVFALLSFSSGNAANLKVAIYPYVPRIVQFEKVITEYWKQLDPETGITWIEDVNQWDGGYSIDPKDSFDLFVFDATYLTYFKNKGWLTGLAGSQIDSLSDFLPFAINGMLIEGKFWAVPQIGCNEYLIFRKNDQDLLLATDLSGIINSLGKCTYKDQIPPRSVGLMADFSGGTTNAIYYVKALEELLATFPVPLPSIIKDFNNTAMNNLRALLAASSLKDAWFSGDPYVRTQWFGQNYGRACVGFSESLTKIPPQQLTDIALKVMPWSDNPAGVKTPLFYCDAIGINPGTVKRATFDKALKLANLMASTNVIVDCLKAFDTCGPQYLTPVRTNAMKQLALMYPAYNAIKTAVDSSGQPVLLNLGNDARTWISKMKQTIKHMIIDSLQCYCDIKAGSPMDNIKAQTVCPEICNGSENWNGQWTNIVGYSVCGCSCTKK
jgi:thiamine pyridinylase